MEENIKYIDIKALKLYNEHGGCVDDYLFMTDNLDDIMQGDKTVKLKVFMMLYCIEGEIRLELNNITCRLKADDLLVSLSNMVMSEVMISSNCRVKIICFFWPFHTKTYTNPEVYMEVLPLFASESGQAF